MTTQHAATNSVTSVAPGDRPLDGGRDAVGVKRERSSIAFPYGDLNDAVAVARALHDNYGSSCAPDQLAAAMGHDTPQSGAFRTKVATARVFGAIEVGRGLISITDLGARLADVDEEAAAQVEAFLNVPLYQRLYEDFRNRKLPGDRGLESEIGRLGVSSKQLNKARIAFQRSADQAGFFAHGNDRLVRPNVAPSRATVRDEPERAPAQRHHQYDDPMALDGLHPLLVGLIKTIPREGESFSPKRQKQWLDAARVNFALIFGGDDDETAEESSGVHSRHQDFS